MIPTTGNAIDSAGDDDADAEVAIAAAAKAAAKPIRGIARHSHRLRPAVIALSAVSTADQSAAVGRSRGPARRAFHHSLNSPTTPLRKAMTMTTKITPWITSTNSPAAAR
jgi:hypothetical protein